MTNQLFHAFLQSNIMCQLGRHASRIVSSYFFKAFLLQSHFLIRTFLIICDTLGCASCATFLFLPHFDVICNLLLNRRTATWNLFVKCNHLDKSGHLGSMFRFLCILPCKCNCMSRQCYCTQRSHHTDCDRPNIH